MKKLTAYNADVQKHMQQNRLSTQKKNEIIDAMRKRIDDTNQSFESLFPSRDVMDRIFIYFQEMAYARFLLKH